MRYESNAVPLRTPSRSPGRSADLSHVHLLGHRLAGLPLLESPTAGGAPGHRGFEMKGMVVWQAKS